MNNRVNLKLKLIQKYSSNAFQVITYFHVTHDKIKIMYTCHKLTHANKFTFRTPPSTNNLTLSRLDISHYHE